MVQAVGRFRTSIREAGRTAVGWKMAAWSYRTEVMAKFLTQSLMHGCKRICLKAICAALDYGVSSTG